MYFGKYKTKQDCQYAIDRAVEKYGDELDRTIINHRKYFSDVKSCGDIKASNYSRVPIGQLPDPVLPNKTLFIKDSKGRVKSYKYAREDGQGDEYVGKEWFESFIVTPDNKLLIWMPNGRFIPYDKCEFWVEDNSVESCSDIKASKEPKYFANMVNASYEGCDYQPNFRFNDDDYYQLAEGDDDPGQEEPSGKYHAYSYYDSKGYGLEDDFISDDPSQIVDWIWEHAAKGGYIELEGPDGSIRLDPDELAERVEMGDIGEYDIISQVDESV